MRTKAALGLLMATTLGCPGGFLGGTIGGNCRGDLGATAAANRVEAFVAAANDFSSAATALQTSLLTACRRMGGDLGIPAGELGGGDGTDATRTACERVTRQVREDLTSLRGTASVRVDVVLVPPRCEVSIDAYGRCAGGCDASYTPGTAEVRCEGGELRGTCTAQCTGQCAVEVTGRCAGTCEGGCSGNMAGGRCDGDCQGRCVASATGSCAGECRGGCSVALREPRCTGRVEPPRVSADCRATCDARLDAQATCTPGRADLRITGEVSSDLQARVTRLRAALGGGFVEILAIRGRAERVVRSGETLGRAIGELPSAARSIGLQAGACAVSAVTATTSALASVQVSVSVSVSVSGSVQAGG